MIPTDFRNQSQFMLYSTVKNFVCSCSESLFYICYLWCSAGWDVHDLGDEENCSDSHWFSWLLQPDTSDGSCHLLDYICTPLLLSKYFPLIFCKPLSSNFRILFFVFCWLMRCALPGWWRKSMGHAISWSTFAHFYCFRLAVHAFLHWLWTLLLIVFCWVELHDSGWWRKSFGFPLIFHD